MRRTMTMIAVTVVAALGATLATQAAAALFECKKCVTDAGGGKATSASFSVTQIGGMAVQGGTNSANFFMGAGPLITRPLGTTGIGPIVLPAVKTPRFAAEGTGGRGASFALDLVAGAPVRLIVYDLRGRLVRTLARGEALPAGRHRIQWDGANERGERLSQGVYFGRVQAGSYMANARVVLAR